MKASVLIEKIRKLIEEHGDAQVRIETIPVAGDVNNVEPCSIADGTIKFLIEL